MKYLNASVYTLKFIAVSGCIALSVLLLTGVWSYC